MAPDKIKARLAALLARARDAGSSMAEVNACMDKAQALMAEYGFTEADVIAAKSADYVDHEIFVADGAKNFSPIDRYVGNAIAAFCGVKIYVASHPLQGGRGRNTNKRRIIYFGLDSDVELALWMRGALRQFMDDQWAEFKKYECHGKTIEHIKRDRIGFIQAFCTEVAKRLRNMAWRNDGEGSGKSLVIVKDKAATTELAKRDVVLHGRAKMKGGAAGSADGAAAGTMAGRAADVGRGVGAGGARLLT